MRSNLHEKRNFVRTGNKAVTVVMGFILASFVFVQACNKDDDDNPGNGGGSLTPNLQMIADGMTSPVGVVAAPGDNSRLFVIDQTGQVWIVKNGTKMSEPFLDISSKMVVLSPQYDERGLLGLAFHPNYGTNGKFYVFYTAPPRAGGPEPGVTWNNLTTIAEYKVSSNADKADMSSERILIQEDHPQMNHDGGTLAFGSDGYLYISIGDGGGADDVGPGHLPDWYATNEGGNAQNIEANFMGKILRIDVDNGSPYGIPSDNPFVGTTGKDEIYAFGFRNPYRFSFDMGGSRQLYVGDAGQKLFEEVNIVEKGGNYGWNVKEGNVCFNADSNLLIRESCPSSDPDGRQLKAPFIEMKNYAHPAGGGLATVVVGGNVYRGSALPVYIGRYIFGIFSQAPMQPDAKLYVANASGNFEELKLKDYPNNLGMYLRGFGQDNAGEIYITTTAGAGVSGSSGKVYKIVGAQ